MKQRDKLKEKSDLQKTKSDLKQNLTKSDICSGILFWTCVGVCLSGAFIRGCQELKKNEYKTKQTPDLVLKSLQNSR